MKPNQTMEYRELGETGLKISTLGYGTSPFGDIYGAIDAEECKRAVQLAVDEGINFFDSSPYYGITRAESRLGEALEGRRDKVVLATKCGRYGRDEFDFSAKRVLESVDESLGRLRTDYLDLLFAHDVEFGDLHQIVGETIPALRKIQKQGKARLIGVTGYPVGMLMRIADQVPVDVILSYCNYNLMSTVMDDRLTPFAAARGIGLINASALHMGVLTERGAPDWHPAPAIVREAAKKVKELCRTHGHEISEVAVRFCLDHPSVSCTLVGMASREEVKGNLALLGVHADARLLAEIRSVIGPALNHVWPSGKPENNA